MFAICEYLKSVTHEYTTYSKNLVYPKKGYRKFNKKTSFPQTCLINGTLITDKFQIAEGFNNYFKTNRHSDQSKHASIK